MLVLRVYNFLPNHRRKLLGFLPTGTCYGSGWSITCHQWPEFVSIPVAGTLTISGGRNTISHTMCVLVRILQPGKGRKVEDMSPLDGTWPQIVSLPCFQSLYIALTFTIILIEILYTADMARVYVNVQFQVKPLITGTSSGVLKNFFYWFDWI